MSTSSIETDLDGGNHEYRGLVIIDAKYTLVPHVIPFKELNYLPTLVIPHVSTLIEALKLKNSHRESGRLCVE